jgi:hypothetical protein
VLPRYKCPKCGSTKSIGAVDQITNIALAPFDMVDGIVSGLCGDTERESMLKTPYCYKCEEGMVEADD